MTYEEALNYRTSMSNSKSQKLLFPNCTSASQKKRRKNSQNQAQIESSIFDRLFNEKDLKRWKLEALKEDYNMQKESEEKLQHKKSRSGSRGKSLSQSEFYDKQMKLKAEADMKLALMMIEQKDMENMVKRVSRSRKRSEMSTKGEDRDVHDRLYNDMRNRSKRRIAIEGN